MADGDVDALPAALDRRACPVGFDGARRSAEREPGAGSLQEAVTSVTWELTAPGAASTPAAPSTGCSARRRCRSSASARASVASTTSARRSCRWRSPPTARHDWSPSWPPSGVACARPSSPRWPSRASTRDGAAGAADTSMDRTRRRPARGAGAAGRRAGAPRWAHEKGTPWTTTDRGRRPDRATADRPPGDAGAEPTAAGDAPTGAGDAATPTATARRASAVAARAAASAGASRTDDAGAPTSTTTPDELPEPLREGRPSVEAAERALVRKPQIGDTRPAPASSRGRDARGAPTPPAARRPRRGASAPAAAPPASGRRRAGDDAERKRSAAAPQAAARAPSAELDDDLVEQRRGPRAQRSSRSGAT